MNVCVYVRTRIYVWVYVGMYECVYVLMYGFMHIFMYVNPCIYGAGVWFFAKQV